MITLDETMWDFLPFAVFRCDTNGQLISGNKMLARFLGRGSIEELLSGGPTDKFSWYDDPVLAEQVVAEIENNGSVLELEVRLASGDGKARLVKECSWSKETPDGMVLEGLFQDLSERDYFHEQLQQTKDRMEDCAVSSSEWFWEMDNDLRFTWMSNSVETIVGRPPEWHYGKSREDIGLPNVDPEDWDDHLGRLKRREAFSDFIFHRTDPNGVRWFKTSGVPIFDNAGEFLGYRGIGADITQRIEAERAAERARDLLFNAVEWLDESFVLWGPDDRLLVANRRFRELNAGFSEFTKPGTRFRDHIRAGLRAGGYPEAIGRERDWYRLRLTQHRHPSGPFELERQDGRWLLIHVQKLRGGSTAVIGTDITRLKEVEMLKSDFVSSVNHELRTPLTAIKGSLDLMQSGAVGVIPEKMSNMVEVGARNANRLIKLVNDLLDMDKIRSGQMRFERELLDLTSVVRRAVESNQPYAEQFNVHLDMTGPTKGKATMVEGDELRLTQVMTNLLSNAAKFSPEGGGVEVIVGAVNGTARVSVVDHGIGIPDEFRQRIFSRFSQVDGSDAKRRGGTGLGLAISKAIVEAHGGSIVFESAMGEGTTFNVEIPIAARGVTRGGARGGAREVTSGIEKGAA